MTQNIISSFKSILKISKIGSRKTIFSSLPANFSIEETFSLQDFENILSSYDFDFGSDINALKGKTIPLLKSKSDLKKLFNEGYTIRINNIHRYHEPLKKMMKEIKKEFSERYSAFHVNGYYSPPNSCGLQFHQDLRDTFVVQVYGNKKWLFLNDDPENFEKVNIKKHLISPNEIIFTTSENIHKAVSQSTPSIHLTFGFQNKVSVYGRKNFYEMENSPTSLSKETEAPLSLS